MSSTVHTLKRSVFAAFGLLLVAAGHGAYASGAELPTLVKKIQPAVVTVVTYDINHEVKGIGTGFFVDRKGRLITNYHVIKGGYAIEVQAGNGAKYPVRAIVAENQGSDLVKLRVDIPRGDYRKVDVVQILPDIAERVVVVGSPMGLEQTVSAGIVSAVRDLPGVGTFFQISAPISRGSSGSPVVNMDGKVIGVASFIVGPGQNLNFAVSGENVLALEHHRPEKPLTEWVYDAGLKTPTTAERLCRDGFRYSVSGEFDKALEFYRQAAEKDPGDTRTWYGLSACYIGLDDSEQATATYKKAIRANPEDEKLHINLGNYYAQLGQFENAVASYETSIRLNPQEAAAYHLLGTAQAELGMLTAAIASQKKGLGIDADNAKAHYNLGVTLTAAGRFEEAIIAYGHAVRLDPDFLQAYNNLGVLHIRLERGQDAVKAHQQVIRIQPDYTEAHLNLGIAYLMTGDKGAALDEYKILKRLDPVMAQTLFELIYD
jgi:tetratricopeptide (TPR) repeat protein